MFFASDQENGSRQLKPSVVIGRSGIAVAGAVGELDGVGDGMREGEGCWVGAGKVTAATGLGVGRAAT
ncbi:MAG TPA: hypothetical protein VHO95_02625 [Candidatus Dormibacteraeota bacterium]|nr:hypothetical protein [Candidatus Dormibacteraeota bacterium]HEX2681225.1 hypothetical protein [Candidatus Dormibacteraeota bacterium]